MTVNDQDSVESYEEEDNKQSRRGRLKDALNRTKTKINKAKEEREARKHHQQQDKVDRSQDADVNDFLSAGRPSSSSQRPSLGGSTTSDVLLSTDSSGSPRPSTSDSRSQPSPRRGPPVSIPRIDVSTSTRFPNAREVNPDDVLLTGHEAVAAASGHLQSALLKPQYKNRSQSSSSIASGSRKARIRGLSVGFATTPPVIIGEGGDEAQAPAIEISRAKARARSASPQGRRPYTNATVQHEARKQLPPRGVSENTADAFVPKAFGRAQTAGVARSDVRGRHDEDFIPKPFRRVQTSATTSSTGSTDDDFAPKPFSRVQTGFSNDGSPAPAARVPILPSRSAQPPQIQVRPNQLPPMKTTGLDLTKEFEMTLGLSPAGSSPATSLAAEAQIVAPKPQRAPPSYDIIEGSGQRQATPTAHPPSLQPQLPSQMGGQSHRKPVPVAKPPHLTQDSQQVTPPRSLQPPQSTGQTGYSQSIPDHVPPSNQLPHQAPQQIQPVPPQQYAATQEMFPPPPHRTKTQTQRIPQKLERILPRGQSHEGAQETGVTGERYTITGRGQPAVNTDVGYGSFADRQMRNPQAVPLAGQPIQNGPTIRTITTQYDDSPSDYSSSKAQTPATAQTPMSARFYENLNRGNAPEGFI